MDNNEGEMMCVEYGSCVPSYNLIMSAKIYGIFLLRVDCWAMAAIADGSECVILFEKWCPGKRIVNGGQHSMQSK